VHRARYLAASVRAFLIGNRSEHPAKYAAARAANPTKNGYSRTIATSPTTARISGLAKRLALERRAYSDAQEHQNEKGKELGGERISAPSFKPIVGQRAWSPSIRRE